MPNDEYTALSQAALHSLDEFFMDRYCEELLAVTALVLQAKRPSLVFFPTHNAE